MTYSKCPICNRDEKYVLIEGDIWHHMCKSNCTNKGHIVTPVDTLADPINNLDDARTFMDQDTFDYIKKRGEDGC